MQTLGKLYKAEMEMEAPASRGCLEGYREDLFGYKPHEKSMQMGYLALMTAEIPRWISVAVKEGVIDFATWKLASFKTGQDSVEILDQNMKEVLELLESVSDEELQKPFELRNKDQVLMNTTKQEMVSSTINHWVHHRGQLTVYMRLNNIPVPSIYGPSADSPSF